MELSTLDIRIQNTKANIEKTQKTLERHQKQLAKYAKQLDERGVDYRDMESARRILANSSRHEDYWLLCDYDSKLDDIKNNEKKLSELTQKLAQYQEQYKKEAARQDIPHIPALEDFLASWKVEAADWYRARVSSYREYYNKCKETRKAIRDKYEPRSYRFRKQIEDEEKAAKVDPVSFRNHLKYNYGPDVIDFAQRGDPGERDFELYLEESLTQEVNAKRVDLYYRCTAAVGVITDAAGLYVGDNGCLNGFVVGETGKAELRTIMASGPIQRLHYRVLVLPFRQKASLDNQIQNAQQRGSAAEGVQSEAMKQKKENSR